MGVRPRFQRAAPTRATGHPHPKKGQVPLECRSDSALGASVQRSAYKRSYVPGSSAARDYFAPQEIRKPRPVVNLEKLESHLLSCEPSPRPENSAPPRFSSLRAGDHRLRGTLLLVLWCTERVAGQFHHLLQVPPFTRVHLPAFVIREID